MKRLVSTLILAVFAVALISCNGTTGVNPSQVVDLQRGKDYETIEMFVNFPRHNNPNLAIYIKAPATAIEFDKEKMEITIKEGYLASSSCSYCFAFRVENAKFSLPVGGRISIGKKDDKGIVRGIILERYGSFKMEDAFP